MIHSGEPDADLESETRKEVARRKKEVEDKVLEKAMIGQVTLFR